MIDRYYHQKKSIDSYIERIAKLYDTRIIHSKIYRLTYKTRRQCDICNELIIKYRPD